MSFEPDVEEKKESERPAISCIHCGGFEIFPGDASHIPICQIDRQHRYCKGVCSKYSPRWWARLLMLTGWQDK